MKKYIYSLIPRKVNNTVVVFFLELLRCLQIPLKKTIAYNFNINSENIINHKSGFIEDQNNYSDLLFGKTTLNYSGCEIIAVFNTLYYFNKTDQMSLERLITSFEQKGMVLSGRFGTSPKAISSFFKAMGYTCGFSTLENEFEKMSSHYDSIILTFYNNKNDISKQIHTISITRQNDMFTAHNVYGNGQILGPYSFVSDLIKEINHGIAKPICVTGVNRK